MDDREKITILLSEYSALSHQITSRFAGQFQLYSMLAPVTIAIFGGYFANYIGWRALAGLLVLTTCIFAWLWFDIDRDIAKAALRIREIEARVNSSAKEPLLEWETKWGRGGVIGKRLLRRPFVPAASHRKRNSDG